MRRTSSLRDFAAFILTNGRPNKVLTYSSLRRSGYTGKIYLLVDDLDPARQQYVDKYGDQVVVFDKREVAKTFDQGDNFNDMRAIIYARNASFEVARKLGVRYFVQLDDDYHHFIYRFDRQLRYAIHPGRGTPVVKDLDHVFGAMLKFYVAAGVDSIAMSQGGDFLGGADGSNPYAKQIYLLRKCMNSFFCSTDRPFKFVGRINEDVNAYTRLGSVGLKMFTTNQVSLGQLQTQHNAGGMTETYVDSGTYVKSFYSVMYSPSSVRIAMIQSDHPRLHHRVYWRNAVPKILRESVRK